MVDWRLIIIHTTPLGSGCNNYMVSIHMQSLRDC